MVRPTATKFGMVTRGEERDSGPSATPPSQEVFWYLLQYEKLQPNVA